MAQVIETRIEPVRAPAQCWTSSNGQSPGGAEANVPSANRSRRGRCELARKEVLALVSSTAQPSATKLSAHRQIARNHAELQTDLFQYASSALQRSSKLLRNSS